jgi:hypothetical protein
MKIVGQKLPHCKFRQGDRITRVFNGVMLVAIVMGYDHIRGTNEVYIDIEVVYVSASLYKGLVGQMRTDSQDQWVKVP